VAKILGKPFMLLDRVLMPHSSYTDNCSETAENSRCLLMFMQRTETPNDRFSGSGRREEKRPLDRSKCK
jgi:hypothetical protein